jgi:hypothetical protein
VLNNNGCGVWKKVQCVCKKIRRVSLNEGKDIEQVWNKKGKCGYELYGYATIVNWMQLRER